ncbi:MAG: tRNA (adenosine(37)-N6)-threonylcarbamoyltransferase complex dimerization subunit type 1 TsaB [Chloroflexi bacterium]|nr:tRNA (adenosine(37)-N6)-threonylcarbamoyltransferase complex dimerization subunit type 1 TsaB [Chloroflexota bacterium]
MLLAIDTSTETMSVALFDDADATRPLRASRFALPASAHVLSELTWHSEQNHTRELLPATDFLLRQAKLTSKDLRAIAVAKGPGSYSGLRVGMSAAKGLALSLSIPLIGVSTLEVEAFPKAGMGLPVCPIFEAGRGELAAAIFQSVAGEWRRLKEEHITETEALCREVSEPTVLCGHMAEATIRQLRDCLGDRAVFIEGAALLRRAGYLAELGWQRLKAGLTDDVATLQPLYLRRPAITKPRYRAQ